MAISADRQLLALSVKGWGEVIGVDGQSLARWSEPNFIAEVSQRCCISHRGHVRIWPSEEALELKPQPPVLEHLDWSAECLLASGFDSAYRIGSDTCVGRSNLLAASPSLLAESGRIINWAGETVLELSEILLPVYISAGALVAGNQETVLRQLPSGEKLGSWERAAFAMSEKYVAIGTHRGLELRRLSDHTVQPLSLLPVGFVKFSGDGNRLLVSYKTDHFHLEVWEVEPARRLLVKNKVSPWSNALSWDGTLLATEGPVQVWTTDAPHRRARFDTGPAKHLCLTSSHLVQAGPQGTHLYHFQIHPHRLRLIANLDHNPWTAMAFRPDGQVGAGLDLDGRVHFFRAGTGEALATFHPFGAEWIWTCPDGLWTATAPVFKLFQQELRFAAAQRQG